ncbi:MAG: hypothetical protein AAFS10_15280, partial [Myxococcota bacterium]
MCARTSEALIAPPSSGLGEGAEAAYIQLRIDDHGGVHVLFSEPEVGLQYRVWTGEQWTGIDIPEDVGGLSMLAQGVVVAERQREGLFEILCLDANDWETWHTVATFDPSDVDTQGGSLLGTELRTPRYNHAEFIHKYITTTVVDSDGEDGGCLAVDPWPRCTTEAESCCARVATRSIIHDLTEGTLRVEEQFNPPYMRERTTDTQEIESVGHDGFTYGMQWTQRFDSFHFALVELTIALWGDDGTERRTHTNAYGEGIVEPGRPTEPLG